MSLQWVICGAGRGVGKTTLAFKLCEILPDCVYAKHGHGSMKPDKPKTFFRSLPELESYLDVSRDLYDHIVVESNALARQSRGDIIIFIDGINGRTNFRKDVDQLRANAHLSVSYDSIVADWKNRLTEKVRSRSLRRAVCDCLLAQKQYLYCSMPVVRSKVWFESAGAHVFGAGLAKLLKNVDDSGTLQKAAKVSGMSYRYAWDLVRMAEKHLGKSLIQRHAGGSNGGGSVLSEHGRQMLEAFRQINEDVSAYADARFEKFFNGGNVKNAGH